jgi:hypothetical protein
MRVLGQKGIWRANGRVGVQTEITKRFSCVWLASLDCITPKLSTSQTGNRLGMAHDLSKNFKNELLVGHEITSMLKRKESEFRGKCAQNNAVQICSFY